MRLQFLLILTCLEFSLRLQQSTMTSNSLRSNRQWQEQALHHPIKKIPLISHLLKGSSIILDDNVGQKHVLFQQINALSCQLQETNRSNQTILSTVYRNIYCFYCYNVLIYSHQQQQYDMIQLIALAALLFCIYVFYRYSYKPRAELRRLKLLLQKLGYKVYVRQFTFFQYSYFREKSKATKLFKDAEYYEQTIYSEVDIVIGNILDKISVSFINPQLSQEFLSGNNLDKYEKDTTLLYNVREVLGDSISFSEGENWKKKKRAISKIFHFDHIKANIPKINQVCDRWLDKYEKNSKSEDNKYRFEMLGLSASVFNGVTMECFLGVDQTEEVANGQRLEDLMVEVVVKSYVAGENPLLITFGKIVWDIGLTQQMRDVKKLVKLFKKKSAEIFKKRKEEISKSPKSEKCTDIIQAMMDYRPQGKSSGFTDDEIMDEIRGILITGTETPAHFLNMVIYYVGKYPEEQRKLREQVSSIILTDEDINYENLRKLTYIDWFMMEVTRHFGPVNVNFERVAVEDHYIKDIPISKGTYVVYVSKGAHYNKQYFKNPEEFRPERWESECDGIHPYTLMGFSGGPRLCIGKQLSYMISKIALVKLIKRYQTIEVPEELTIGKYMVDPFETTLTKAGL